MWLLSNKCPYGGENRFSLLQLVYKEPSLMKENNFAMAVGSAAGHLISLGEQVL